MRFINKNPRPTASTPVVVTTVATPESITGLVATNLTTGLVSTSTVVTKDGSSSQTISLSDISFWIKTGDKLEIHSKDQKPLSLTFTSPTEAGLGEVRFHNMMNGASY